MKVEKKALIIGCGTIGCFYDSPSSSEIETHSHVLKQFGYALYFYDQNTENANKAALLWSGEKVDSLTESKFEIVVVASSTRSHFEILISLNPSLFDVLIVEKPFCESSDLAAQVMARFKDKIVFVNYSRLYLEEYHRLKLRFTKGDFGKCNSFLGVYSKGLLNNGSHLLSLLKFVLNFNNIKNKTLKKTVEKKSGLANYDVYFESDNEITGNFLGLDDSDYSFWEMTLFFEKAVVKINNFGKNIQILPQLKGPINVAKDEEYSIDYSNALMNLYKKVEERDVAFAKATNDNALFVHEIIENILGEK